MKQRSRRLAVSLVSICAPLAASASPGASDFLSCTSRAPEPLLALFTFDFTNGTGSSMGLRSDIALGTVTTPDATGAFSLTSQQEEIDWTRPEYEGVCATFVERSEAHFSVEPETGGRYWGTYLSGLFVEFNPLYQGPVCSIPPIAPPVPVALHCGTLDGLP